MWQRWLALDPVRMAAGHADALRSMRGIWLDAGHGGIEYRYPLALGFLAERLSADR